MLSRLVMESSERPEYSERERTRNTASKYDFVKVSLGFTLWFVKLNLYAH